MKTRHPKVSCFFVFTHFQRFCQPLYYTFPKIFIFSSEKFGASKQNDYLCTAHFQMEFLTR